MLKHTLFVPVLRILPGLAFPTTITAQNALPAVLICSSGRLSEPCRAATHDLALANKLGIEFRPIEREVDVEVDTIEGSLRCVHALEILFEILPAEIRRESNNFLNACIPLVLVPTDTMINLRGSFVYSGQTSSSQAYSTSSYINVAPGATCLKNETLTGSPIFTL